MEENTLNLSEIKASQATSYQGLAKQASDLGESWVALNAQAAALWLALQFAAVKFSGKLSTSEDIETKLNDMWKDSDEAVTALVDEAEDSLSVSDILSAMYDTTTSHLNSRGKKFITARVADPQEFSHLPIDKDSLSRHFGWHHFGEASTAIVVSRKLYDARKLYKEFYMLRDESGVAAYSALYQADMLTFESWVLQRGADANDTSRVFAGIQIAIANAYLNQLPGIPVNPVAYEQMVRGSFARTLGIDDAREFAKTLPLINI